MNSILGPVLAIVATVVLLLLRELLLAVGKRDRDSYGAGDHHPPVPGSDFQRKHSLYAQEQSPWSLTRNGSTTEFGRTQSNREGYGERLMVKRAYEEPSADVADFAEMRPGLEYSPPGVSRCPDVPGFSSFVPRIVVGTGGRDEE